MKLQGRTSWGHPGSSWRGPLVWDVALEKAGKIGRRCSQEPTGRDSNERLCARVHGSIVHTSQKWSQPKCSSTDQQNVVYPNNGILLSLKKEGTFDMS